MTDERLIDYARWLGAEPGEEADTILQYLEFCKDSEAAFKLKRLSDSGKRYPDIWRIGDIVEYVSRDPYGYKIPGVRAQIVELSPECKNTPANKYQVFWTSPINSKHTPRLWTTPDDVIFIERGN